MKLTSVIFLAGLLFLVRTAPLLGEDKTAIKRDLYGDPLPAGAIARLGGLEYRFGEVRSIEFCRGGKALIASASAFASDYLRVWNIATKQREKLVLPLERINGLMTVAPDGVTVALVGLENRIYIFNLDHPETFRELAKFEVTIYHLAFSPNGKSLAVGCDHTKDPLFIDVASGTQRDNHIDMSSKEAVICAVYSPDGSMVAVSDGDGRVNLLDAKQGEVLAHWQYPGESGDNVRSLSFSVDSRFLAGFYSNQYIQIWDAQAKRKVRRLPTSGPGMVQFTGERDVLAYTDRGTKKVHWYDCERQKEIKSIDPQFEKSFHFSLSPDGKLLALKTGGRGFGEVGLYDIEKGQYVFKMEGHRAWVTDVEFSSDGTKLASGSNDGTVRIWEVATGKPLWHSSLLPSPVTKVALAENGKWVAATLEDESFYLWSTEETNPRLHLEGVGGGAQLDFSPTSDRICVTDEAGVLRVFNPTGEMPFQSEVGCLALIRWAKPKEIYLVVQPEPLTAQNVRTLREAKELTLSRRATLENAFEETTIYRMELSMRAKVDLAMNQGNPLLVTTEPKSGVDVWNWNDLSHVNHFDGGSQYRTVACLIDRGRLVVGVRHANHLPLTVFEPSIVGWEVKNKQHLLALDPHLNRFVECMAACEQEPKLFATGGEDGTVLIWNVDKILKEAEYHPIPIRERVRKQNNGIRQQE